MLPTRRQTKTIVSMATSTGRRWHPKGEMVDGKGTAVVSPPVLTNICFPLPSCYYSEKKGWRAVWEISCKRKGPLVTLPQNVATRGDEQASVDANSTSSTSSQGGASHNHNLTNDKHNSSSRGGKKKRTCTTGPARDPQQRWQVHGTRLSTSYLREQHTGFTINTVQGRRRLEP